MNISKTKNTLRNAALGALSLTPLLFSAPVFAASATMSLSSVGSVVKGGAITVSVRENSGGDGVNVGTVVVNYPADKLTYLSATCSNAFSIKASGSGGSGTVSIDCGAASAVSGSQTVSTISFRALSDNGTATLGIASGSVDLADGSGTNILAGTNGTNIALKPVPPPVAAAPVPPPDTTPPTITNLKISQVTATSALVSWTTSEPASSIVEYGTSPAYGLTASDGNLVTDHKVTLNSPIITPATPYHTVIKSADASGNAVSSPDTIFTTTGISLQVIVSTPQNKPLKGAKVQILDKTVLTDKDGQAIISGLALGKHTLAVSYKGRSVSKTVTISQPTDPKKLQREKVQIKPSASVLPFVILALLAAAGALAWYKRKEARLLFEKLRARNAAGVVPVPPTTMSEDRVVKPNKPR